MWKKYPIPTNTVEIPTKARIIPTKQAEIPTKVVFCKESRHINSRCFFFYYRANACWDSENR
ncbi:hypothetical protein SAMN05518871_11622, partial [Psychrobacillus sp. OK028]|uniref:hypothetical protein n=1 Tax=Psychrobacillus sp. OK028 TaxID=1884359 RepID=UPI00087E5CF3